MNIVKEVKIVNNKKVTWSKTHDVLLVAMFSIDIEGLITRNEPVHFCWCNKPCTSTGNQRTFLSPPLLGFSSCSYPRQNRCFGMFWFSPTSCFSVLPLPRLLAAAPQYWTCDQLGMLNTRLQHLIGDLLTTNLVQNVSLWSFSSLIGSVARDTMAPTRPERRKEKRPKWR